MKFIFVALTLLSYGQLSLAKTDPAEDHACFPTARSIAINVLKNFGDDNRLKESGLDHDRCMYVDHTIQCFRGKEAVTEFEATLTKEHVSPTRDDFEFDFQHRTQGLNIGVIVWLKSTTTRKCQYLNTQFYFESTGEE